MDAWLAGCVCINGDSDDSLRSTGHCTRDWLYKQLVVTKDVAMQVVSAAPPQVIVFIMADDLGQCWYKGNKYIPFHTSA